MLRDEMALELVWEIHLPCKTGGDIRGLTLWKLMMIC